MTMEILFNNSIKELSSSEIRTYLTTMFKQDQSNYPLPQKELVPEQSASTTSNHLRKAASVGLIVNIKSPKVLCNGLWISSANSYKPLSPTYKIKVEHEEDINIAVNTIVKWKISSQLIQEGTIINL